MLIASVGSVFQTLLNILLALLVFLFMITVHEFGHFISGRLLGFQIDEFAVGMGPKILSKKAKNGTVYSLRAFPLGGFCAFEGETDDVDNPKAFNNQKPWKRIIVLVSGALFNFISAIIICCIVFLCYGDTVVKVQKVYDYAPAINQQLEGKIIYKINGKRVFLLDSLSRYMDDTMEIEVINEKGEFETYSGIVMGEYYVPTISKIDTKIENNAKDKRALAQGDTIYSAEYDEKTVYFSQKNSYQDFLKSVDGTFKLTVLDLDGESYVYTLSKDTANFEIVESYYNGVGMSITDETYKFGFGESLARVFPFCGEVAILVLRTVGGLITGVVGIDAVGGPISTIGMTTQVVSRGFAKILLLIVLISVNLAVFNLLPVPALDGCQIVFVIIEWIAGKPINRKVQGYINGIGLILLLILTVLIDILKL